MQAGLTEVATPYLKEKGLVGAAAPLRHLVAAHPLQNR